MDHSSSMPLSEAIVVPSLSSTYGEYTTSMDARITTAQVAETVEIANMTTDDDSSQLVAPSVHCGVVPRDQGSSSNEDSLFDVPTEFLQHSDQLSFDNSSGKRSTTVFRISARQYDDMQANYAKHSLPSDSLLFPWLHGVNGSNYQECLFFGVRRMVVPKHRGLVLIHATDIDSDRHNSVSSAVSGTAPSALHSRLVQSFLPQDILTSRHGQNLEEDWVFRDAISTREKPGIHLRNFKIQSWRYASISDIVLYGDQAEAIAHRVSMAQHHIFEERKLYHQRLQKSSGRRAVMNSNNIIYRIFIIEDTIETFERCFPGLVWYNSNGLLLNDISLLEREKMEMREMSSAKELTENVWLGNTYDVPASTNRGEYSDDMNEDIQEDGIPITNEDEENPNQYSVCIECHDLSDMPLPSILTLARETLNELGQDELPSEVIHLDMYSTGSLIDTAEQMNSFLENLTQLLQFMDEISRNGRRILIHCADGYTETSVLSLAWLMFKRRFSLPKAYLYLQDQRSFFVVSSDIPFLQAIEQYFQNNGTTLPSHHQKAVECSSQHQKRKRAGTAKLELPASLPSLQLYNTDLRTNSTIQQPHHKIHVQSLYDDRYIDPIPNDHIINANSSMFYESMDGEETGIDESIINKRNQSERCPTSPLDLSLPCHEQMTEHQWFFSPRFEGSFPSRIMPFLYLGNLNHATNPAMLKALGITHVVSVGENANLNPKHFKLLYLDNLYDDGIDSIRNRYDEAMTFIDEAFTRKTRCLVHCRVGVSRSAAITICYVMHHFQTMSLADAYIFVRARRLNVIIQPNLKFMYEMLQLEQTLLGKVHLTWPVLCHQIHLLNETYDED